MKTIQEAWEDWSAVTGIKGVDIGKCSHGRAFEAGWNAALEAFASLNENDLVERKKDDA